MIRNYRHLFFIAILLLIILPVVISAETNKETKEADWTNATDINEGAISWIINSNHSMKWGDKIDINEWALGNFTIELTDLMKDATSTKIVGGLLTVAGENKFARVAIAEDEPQTVALGEPFYDDEMKISASINGSRTWSRELFEPNMTVRVFLRAKPDINLSYNIFTENPETNSDINSTDNLHSNELFFIRISVQNNGNATLKNAKLELNLTSFSLPEGEIIQRQGMTFRKVGSSLIYDLNDLKVDEIRTLNLSLKAPLTPANSPFSIPVMLTGNDNKNVVYRFRTENRLVVKPFIEIIKQIGPYVNYSGTDILYVGESFWTMLTVKNEGNKEAVVNLIDSVPESFEYQSKDNQSLNWTLIVPAGSSQKTTYMIKPTKYKESVIIPKATARFDFEGKKYSVDSNEISMKMKGSEVVLLKDIRINQQNNGIINATIILTAKNLGDQRVAIKINDTIAENVTLMNGNTSISTIFLDKSSSFSYSYDISIPSGEGVIMPPANGYFIDFRAYIENDNMKTAESWHEIKSNRPSIEIKATRQEIKPDEISNRNGTDILQTPSIKKEKNTKFEIIKNIILKFFEFIMGKERIETSLPISQPEIQPVIRRLEENNSFYTWTLGWESQENDNASGGNWKVSTIPGSALTVSFSGTGLALIYVSGPEGGVANVKIDGESYADIDMYSPDPGAGIRRTVASGLENEHHTLELTVSNTKNPVSSDYKVVVDAVEITQS